MKDKCKLGVVASCVIFISLLSPVVWSDTSVSGPIFGNVTWTAANSPYRVTANVLVMSTASLTIEPGVIVRFDGTNALQIDGTLTARGTALLPITFTASGANNWGFIYFRTASTDAVYDGGGNYVSGSILEYCIIEKAGGANVTGNGAVRLEDAHPFINHCTIQDNIATGIYAWSLSKVLKITHSQISGNMAGGLYAQGGSVTLQDCMIDENINNSGAGGVYLSTNNATVNSCQIIENISNYYNAGGMEIWSGSADIQRNSITDNSSPSNVAGFFLSSTTGTVSMNDISYNIGSHGGVYLYGGDTAFSDNIIKRNAGTITGGLSIISYTGNSTAVVRNMIIENDTDNVGGGIYFNQWWNYPIISNNIIADNSADVTGGGIHIDGGYDVDLLHNSICRNAAPNASACVTGTQNSNSISYNTISQNNTEGGSPDSTIYIQGEAQPLLTYNNIFANGATYALWNNNSNTSPDVDASGNWWGTSIVSQIEDMIYHYVDDSSRGFVNYFAFDTQIRTDCPVSPPTGLTVSTTANSIILNWNANPETDVAGYKVYWGTTEPPLYEHVVNVGNTTNYTITPLPQGMYYVGVTAYDTAYNPANEDPDTILNDNQTNGNESYYVSSLAFVGLADPRVIALVQPNGGQSIMAGSIYDITWQSEGAIEDIRIELSLDNGASWQPIITADNDGLYSWRTPQVNSNQCLIRISDAGDLEITDISDTVFTLFICQYLPLDGDIDKDCYVNLNDVNILALNWLRCGNIYDPSCP